MCLLAIAGIVPGVLLAYAAGRSMEALLAGVRPADALTLASAIALTLVMTVLGTLAPTLRALRVDPITALQSRVTRRRRTKSAGGCAATQPGARRQDRSRGRDASG